MSLDVFLVILGVFGFCVNAGLLVMGVLLHRRERRDFQRLIDGIRARGHWLVYFENGVEVRREWVAGAKESQ